MARIVFAGGTSHTPMLLAADETLPRFAETDQRMKHRDKDGRLRALAVTGRARTPLTGDLPTMSEAGLRGYEVTTFYGLVAPAGTPEPVVALLNAAINDGLRTPGIEADIRRLGAVAAPGSTMEFATFIAAEERKWSAVARAANVHVD